MQFLVTALMMVILGVPLAAWGEDSVHVDLQMENIFFPSGSNMVHAFVYKPQGRGKFPAIIFNQATRDPYYTADGLYPFETLAKWSVKHGYVLFIPDRPGHENLGRELGEFADLLDDKTDLTPTNRIFLEGFDLIGKDVSAGTTWLSKQTYVNDQKMGMIGHSTGAMQTLLLATKESRIRGFVAFSPGAKIWKDNKMIPALLGNAVQHAKGPVLLIQAKNDFNLRPCEDLRAEIEKRPAPNAVKIYPAFGKAATEAIMFGVHGAPVWGDDVARFFEEVWQ